jgi:epoxyqueuosine reductase
MIVKAAIDKTAAEFLVGATDMHVHSGRDHVARLMTDEEAIGQALRSGMKGLVLKSHTRCTLEGCNQAQRTLGVQGAAFASMVLNSWQDMEDIAAMEKAIASGLKLIYMPTVMSANPLNPVRLDGKRMSLLEGGRLRPTVVRVIETAVKGGCTIATGHASGAECLSILDCCHALGAPTVLVTHPDYWVTDMPDCQQDRVARKFPNVVFERTLYSILNEDEARLRPGTLAIVSEKLGRVVENIRRIGARRTILSSDLGQTWNPPPAEGLGLFLQMIASAGISAEDIRRMTLANPCRALGLYNEMIQCEVELALAEAKESFTTPFDGALVGFADAGDAAFGALKRAVGPQHLLPQDVLAGARGVVSVFLAFGREVVEGNSSGLSPTPAWCRAYTEGNRCLDVLITAAAEAIGRCGFTAEVHRGSHHLTNLHEPSVDPALLTSCWSQRHVAHICGLGTFGVSNLLITAKGSAGRFASLVTDMPLRPLAVQTEERCLGKQGGGTQCMECVKRCPAGALSSEGFDRMACWNYLVANNHISRDAGIPIVNVCGKCSSGVPCALLGGDGRRGARA